MRNPALVSSERSDWRTPREVWAVLRQFNAGILDPCADSNPGNHAADFNYTIEDDGLVSNWDIPDALVYCNPPYGNGMLHWIERAIREDGEGCEIILLTPARPGSQWWRRCWTSARAYCFWDGRIKFVGAEQGAPFPSIFWYWGRRKFKFCSVFEPHGLVGTL